MTTTSLPLQAPPAALTAAPRWAASGGVCALVLALGVDWYAGTHSATPGSTASFAASVLTVLGLLLLAATALTARRAIARLQHQLREQSLEMQHLAAMAEGGQRSALKAKLRALWVALPAGVLVHDSRGRIAEANPVALRLMGEKLSALRERDVADPRWRALRPDASLLDLAEDPVQRVLRSGKPLHGQTVGLRTPAGAIRWLLLNAEPQHDATGRVTGAVSCFVDMTEQRSLQAQFAPPAHKGASAVHTALPQLVDHAAVLLRVQQALVHQQRHPGYGFAVVCVGFEPDTAEPPAAAVAVLRLQQAAHLLKLLRPGDAVAHGGADPELAGRPGSDGFVLVLDGVGDEATLRTIAERLHADLSESDLTPGEAAPGRVSLGTVACCLAEDGLTAADVLRRAELALLDATLAGPGQWRLYEAAMAGRVVQDQAQHSELRRALAEGELTVVYQPLVRLADSSLAGVEALLRWRHPTRGLLPPVAFIDQAESGGLGAAVAEAVWHEACAQFMQWQRTLGAAAPSRLAVNVSAAQLEAAEPALAARLASVLHEAGMPAQQLQVEYTEGPAHGAPQQRAATLVALQALGVRLALDDFGTGESSLARLHGATLDMVKIDGSFVHDVAGRNHHRMLIEATVRVAAERGMTTLAEGIETADEAAQMAELGCELAQGFLYSRPLSAAAFTAWLQGGAAIPQLCVANG